MGRIPGTGEQALAAIGICAPALTAISAFAYMVGIGGASLMSISLGQGNQRRARQALGNAFWLVIAIAVAVTAVLLPLHRPLLYCWAAATPSTPMPWPSLRWCGPACAGNCRP